MDIKVSLDGIASFLIDPSNNHRTPLNVKLAWLTTIILGIGTFGIAQGLSALWRKLRHIERNDTHEKIGDIFSGIFDKNSPVKNEDNMQPMQSVSDCSVAEQKNIASTAIHTTSTPSARLKLKAVINFNRDYFPNTKRKKEFEHTLSEQLSACGIDFIPISKDSEASTSEADIELFVTRLKSRPVVDYEDLVAQLEESNIFKRGILIMEASQVDEIGKYFVNSDKFNAHLGLKSYNKRWGETTQIVLAPFCDHVPTDETWQQSISSKRIAQNQEKYEEVKKDPKQLRIFIAQLINDTTLARCHLPKSKIKLSRVYS